MFLSKEVVLKKLNAAKAKQLPDIEKKISKAKKDMFVIAGNSYLAATLRRLENLTKGFKAVPGIPYRPRSGAFYNGRMGFDPATGRAHSYDWYTLGQVMGKQYVVNSYRYSQQTNNHFYALCSTLKMLGVKYIEIEAPKGLQDLESSQTLYCQRIAEATIAIKYGSKKCEPWRKRTIRENQKMLYVLSDFGVKTPPSLLASFITRAENNRTDRLTYVQKQRDSVILSKYLQAMRENDLKGIVKFHTLNKKRVERGLSELKP